MSRSGAAGLLAAVVLGAGPAWSAEGEGAAVPRPVVAGAGTEAIDDARLRAADSDPNDWITHGRDYAEQRFSPLAQVNDGNVGRLVRVWTYPTGLTRGHEATPIVVDGVMYATGSWSVVFALDAKTGKELWRFDPEVPKSVGAKACCDVVNRGVAVYEGKIYFGALDGRLIALDAKTGKPVWSVVTVDQEKAYTITGAPRIVKGRVIIGNGGAEFGVRGYVSAYDTKDGKLEQPITPAMVDGLLSGRPDADGKREDLYHRWCSRCHGVTAISGGALADLRLSSPDVQSAFVEIVQKGMPGVGMPAFAGILSEAEIREIQTYVKSRPH